MRLRMLRDQGPNRFDILEAEATTLKDSSLAHALFFTPPTGGSPEQNYFRPKRAKLLPLGLPVYRRPLAFNARSFFAKRTQSQHTEVLNQNAPRVQQENQVVDAA